VDADLPCVTFRRDAIGGDVSEPRVCPPRALLARPHVVLLIHGFNVTEERGLETYRRFVGRLRDILAIPRDVPVADDRLVALYWPGDADWGFAKPLAYMRSVPRARDIGAGLAKLLDDSVGAHPFIAVDIVAHSLGCRLALETLLAVSTAPGSRVRIDRIQFMAGAAPTFMLDDTDDTPRLRAAFEASLGSGAKSLYSGSDLVLTAAFPPGQTLAGKGEGFMPTALGHAKWPSHGELGCIDPVEMPGAGHGSYWGGDDPDYSRETALIAHEFLGMPDAVIKELPQRDIVDRALDDAAPIPDRQIASRGTAQIC
jgi:pimeloyl-ACP methyl ester carboxylesterase